MLKYRLLQEKDIKKIQNLALKAWFFTYKGIYTEKTIRKEVAKFYSDKNFKRFIDRINKEKDYFIVAIDKSDVLGYAHIGLKNNIWELHRLYVNPYQIGKGIGSRLVHLIEKFLKSKRAKKYIIYPHIKNKIAIRFYHKIGFRREKLKDRSKSSICFQKYLI